MLYKTHKSRCLLIACFAKLNHDAIMGAVISSSEESDNESSSDLSSDSGFLFGDDSTTEEEDERPSIIHKPLQLYVATKLLSFFICWK